MANKIEVEVLEAGNGKVFMASDMKALPVAKTGDIISVKAGAYADGVVASGYVAYLQSEQPALEVAAPAPIDDLTTINGLGKSSAGKLAQAGVHTFAELAVVDTAVLSEVTGIAVNKLEEWQAAAQTLTEEGN